MAPVIVAEELRKEFVVERRRPGLRGALRALVHPQRERLAAVDGVSFTVQAGEVVGYLGPNGAGKSTTIRMLSGILVPTSGRALVNGREPYRERLANAMDIGAVFGQRSQLWWDLPAVESFRILKEMYGVDDRAYRSAIDAFDELLEIRSFWQRPVRQLSLGERMRCDLAVAMLHDPAILYLDEPTIGMDVVAKERVRRFLLHVARTRGTTVLLTTHDLGDVERLCRRVLLIDHGRLVFDGDVEELKRREGAERVLRVRFAEEVADPAVPGLRRLALDGVRAAFALPLTAKPHECISRLAALYPVADVTIEEPALEEVIRALYERRAAAPGAAAGG